MNLVLPGGHVAITIAALVSYRFEFRATDIERAPFDGVVVVHDDHVALPRGRALECRADGLWFSCVEEVAGEHWTFGLEAFGLRYDTPEEAAAGGFGERLQIGYDLEWESAGGVPGGSVHGEVLVGTGVIVVDGSGTFVA